MSGTELRISGALHHASMIPWICHRARLLDLAGWVDRDPDGALTVTLWGPAPLIDCMEIACSLGPADSLVEDISRNGCNAHSAPSGFTDRSPA